MSKELDSLHLFEGTILPHYTKEQLDNWIAGKEKEELAGYEKIYSVANGEKLIL